MSIDPKATRVVSLADEEAVKEILGKTVLVEWAKTAMLDPRLALANAEDLQIPQCVDTADEAIAVVRDLHANWKTRT